MLQEKNSDWLTMWEKKRLVLTRKSTLFKSVSKNLVFIVVCFLFVCFFYYVHTTGRHYFEIIPRLVS